MGKGINKPSFSLVGLKITDLSIRLKEIKKLEPQVNLRHNFSASFAYRNELDIIQLVLNLVIFIQMDANQSVQIADSTILFDFKIENIKEWMKGGKLIVPAKVAKTFILEGLSTARGIIWVKLSGTSLNNVVIPLIKNEELKNQDLEFIPQA